MSNTQKIPVVAVLGPTASGKTSLAVALSKRFGGEVVSCDSMQIYKEMSISTAKPTPEEMQGVPHHMLDLMSVGESFSVADYIPAAGKAIGEIAARGNRVFLCGGTGQYADSLLNGMRFDEAEDNGEKRAELAAYLEQNGPEALVARLAAADPGAPALIDVKNPKRVLRALEIVEGQKIPLAEYRRRNVGTEPPYDALRLVIDFRDRQRLYERIDKRVEKMLSDGLVKEAETVYNKNIATAGQAIGCKELGDYFAGTRSLDECVENIKRATRHYAKRQQTWFRREPGAVVLYADAEDIFARAARVCEEFFEGEKT